MVTRFPARFCLAIAPKTLPSSAQKESSVASRSFDASVLLANMASGRRKKSKEEPAVKQEDKKEDKPVKRRRSADGDRQFRDDKRQKVSEALKCRHGFSTFVQDRVAYFVLLCRLHQRTTEESGRKSSVPEFRPQQGLLRS